MLSYGLFAGVGGLEFGLEIAGIHTVRLVEYEELQRRVLRARFPHASIAADVMDEVSIPPGATIITAGFPCKDFSPLGECKGLEGCKSSLVNEVFRLLQTRNNVDTVLIENVENILRLRKGQAMEYIVSAFEALGFDWAYRLVDTRSWGIPHRRWRVFLLASRSVDPRDVLLSGDAEPVVEPPREDWARYASAFYPHMGGTGMGLAVNCVPTLVCGSAKNIASPPAILWYGEEVFYLAIEDAERLQGFPEGWTEPMGGYGARLTAVGNSVTVPVSHWIGVRLYSPQAYDDALSYDLPSSWPAAAWGVGGDRAAADVSPYPVGAGYIDLGEYLLRRGATPSKKAISGFLRRYRRHMRLKLPGGFEALLEKYV